jgi:hypothetical protein
MYVVLDGLYKYTASIIMLCKVLAKAPSISKKAPSVKMEIKLKF